jgi:undecaprenyl-diphosphatase
MKRLASHRGLIAAAHNRQLMHASLLIAAAADHSNHAAHLSWFQVVVLGAVQGVTELFPISSLGHTVLLPTLFGWTQLVKDQSDAESYWLALVVMLHVGSALGLLAYFWRDWIAIIRAFFRSLWRQRIETPTEKLAWLIIAASIPVGVIGLALEHPLRVLFAKPTAAAIFLMINGLILLGAERLRRRAPARAASASDAYAYAGAGPDPGGGRVRPSVPGSGGAGPVAPRLLEAGNAPAADESAELSQITFRNAVGIGFAQSAALIAGISRDGVCMSAGLLSGLDNETAARFAFLLATPIILAAGIFKLPDLTGPLGNGIRLQAAVACGCAAITAVVAVHYLLRYFQTRTLVPFGLYCLGFGLAMTIYTIV